MSKLIKKDDFRDNCGFGLIANINGIKSVSYTHLTLPTNREV